MRDIIVEEAQRREVKMHRLRNCGGVSETLV